jgi:hypothetical protein
MSQSTELLKISLKECRQDWLHNFLNETFISLESQGFTFEEILDGLMSHAYMTQQSADTVFFLAKASLSLRNKRNG